MCIILYVFCQSKGDAMVVYLLLLEEGGCYSYSSNIGDVFINKHAQSIVYGVTNKHHVYSLLECTTIAHILTGD